MRCRLTNPPTSLSSRLDCNGRQEGTTGQLCWTRGLKAVLSIGIWFINSGYPLPHSATRFRSVHSMDSHFQTSLIPRYPSHSSRLVTTQRPWRFTSLTHPWPRWCWAIPGSSSTTPELTGARILCPCGVRNVMRPVLCLPVPLCLVCRCRMRR